jgi:hypothetical protein
MNSVIQGYQHFDIQTYGPHKLVPDQVILVPHDGPPEPFLKKFPHLAKAAEMEPQVLHQMLELERDTFSRELAERVAHVLADNGKSVWVLAATVPRGIYDMNRVLGQGVRTPWHTMRNHKDILALRGENNRMQALVQGLLGAEVPFLDLHTMWSHNFGTDFPGIETGQTYVDAMFEARRTQSARPICIMTGPGGMYRASYYSKMRSALVDAEENVPYGIGPGFWVTASSLGMAPNRNFTTVDIPKGHLGDSIESDAGFKHNEAKMQDMTSRLVSALS